jgi:hypothetical protein
MTCPSFEHNLVIYLMTLVERAIQLSLASKHENIPMETTLGYMINITQVAHLGLSSLINIFATSIITLKAWYVRVYGALGIFR